MKQTMIYTGGKFSKLSWLGIDDVMFSLKQERQPERLIVIGQAVKQQHNFCHV